MEKLKKFNQVLFAILGSLLVIVLLIAAFNIIADFFPDDYVNRDRLIVEDEADSLKKENLRKQVISLEMMEEFDSALSIYLIPVRQKTLTDASSRSKQVFGLIGSSDYEEYYSYGNWNNLILYNFIEGTHKTLVNHRVNIDYYKMLKRNSDRYIIFTGWIKDTNQDGELGFGDFKETYVYHYSSDQLLRIKNDTYLITEIKFYRDINHLILRAVKKPEPDQIIIDELPEILLDYSFEDNELVPLIDNATLNKIQSIIDG